MKKKIMVALFASVMLVSLTACTGNSGTTSKSTESTEETTSSSIVESTEESSSSEPVETTSPAGNSSNFSLMVEAAQSQIPTLKEQLGSMYSDIAISEGENSTLVYTYTFAQDPGYEIDGEALKPTMVKGVKPVIDSMKVMFPEVKVQVICLKPDGSEMINFIITQEDTNQIEGEPA